LTASQVGGLVAGQRIELDDLLDLVAEERQPPGAVLVGGTGKISTVSPRTRKAPR
jgi:hypothetical protein